jgi:hypothetical protein
VKNVLLSSKRVLGGDGRWDWLRMRVKRQRIEAVQNKRCFFGAQVSSPAGPLEKKASR